jgi:tetratricopeptide (TPR) repeat protein/transcriptional regulator with XRE-family HTH domain
MFLLNKHGFTTVHALIMNPFSMLSHLAGLIWPYIVSKVYQFAFDRPVASCYISIMAKSSSFLADVLTRFVSRAGYTSGQLARLTGIPKATIVNWMEGRVKRPRGSEDLLRLAAILHLDEIDATELLQAAGHPSIAELREQALRGSAAPGTANLGSGVQKSAGELTALLAPWKKQRETRPEHVPFQAIADLPHFVGREQLRQELSSALLAGEHSGIYTLQGMGGVGKTALAAHLAYELRPHFPDGILWARVDTSDTMSILSTFGRAYGHDVSQYTDLDSRSRVVRDLLADKRALMVLDNVESSEQMIPLLPPSGTCAVLITTRRRHLAITRGAQHFLLSPFNEAGNEALRLFAKVLGAERSAAEEASLQAIAGLLGHLPLAVDVVASRLAYEPGWSAADFLRRLRQEQRRLRELTFEQQSVRVSIQLSYQALLPAEQAFFSALGIFPGQDFSVPAAAHVAFGRGSDSAGEETQMDAEDLLRQLFGLSLVRRARPGRYRLHPLLRDFARTQIDDPRIVRRMVAYFVAFVAQHRRDFQALDQEYDNILGALAAAQENQLNPFFVNGVTAFYHFLEARGQYEVAESLLAAARQVAEEQADVPNRVFILRCQGRIAERRADYNRAEQYFEAGLQLARRVAGASTENPVGNGVISDLLRALGVLAARRGDYGLAEAYYQEGLLLARQLAPGDTLGQLLRGLGVEAFSRNDYTRAEALIEEGLALPYAGGDQERQGALLWALGLLAADQGNLSDAEGYLQQSAALARELGQLERLTQVQRDLGIIAREQHDLPQATVYLREGLAVARALGHTWRINRILIELGGLCLAMGETEEAEAAFEEVLQIAREAGSQVMTAHALFGLAQVAAGKNDPATAQRTGRAALALFQQIGHHQAGDVQDWLVQYETVRI